ncbi:hypothetical protein PPL_02763 [Heterostelium album PN500]|uniref:Single domain-containing protein n=1 Tax=Heterostelium pallidum (strain ATCC 26659 / Pp 5 / PN500) TaxID=670386 RepID=D3B2Z8_HETP5|nr:hypothetical protein PPL_02763 [Heterostelium album PN500]EFA83696.1 hypothetical protein PPL_02763 [Heterostelium album PN500]|eukprot:XP_020435813.1 hypothetical protein PPL_02763 [Heterostelium album PN500]
MVRARCQGLREQQMGGYKKVYCKERKLEEGCKVISIDEDAPYPDCCPKIECGYSF